MNVENHKLATGGSHKSIMEIGNLLSYFIVVNDIDIPSLIFMARCKVRKK